MRISLQNIRTLSRVAVPLGSRRTLLTLAIETSCDDTSVALLEKQDHPQDECGRPRSVVRLLFHEKITSNNLAHRGIHPIVALESHEQNLAKLVDRAIKSLAPINDENPSASSLESAETGLQRPVRKPHFVTVTRGPGMRSNLATGLNTAKGLAIAWQIPLLAVNHMQAHALTPRLASALESTARSGVEPKFPFLSLLVSGGHTMLIHSKSLTEHTTIASTTDIAVGDALDKIAREVLPVDVLENSNSTMYGPILEHFAFPDQHYNYIPPRTREQELSRRITSWGWSFVPPLAETRSGSKSKALEYSFTGLCTAAKRITESRMHVLSEEERRDLARETMRVAFEHLASRVVLWLQIVQKQDPSSVKNLSTLVVSGGVAANKYLKHVLRAFLDVRGFDTIEIVSPPLALCTDNAAMIAWTGIEMFEAGYRSSLSCQALRKWSLDPAAEDGGILGVPGWTVGDQIQRDSEVAFDDAI